MGVWPECLRVRAAPIEIRSKAKKDEEVTGDFEPVREPCEVKCSNLSYVSCTQRVWHGMPTETFGLQWRRSFIVCWND
jgi:hypothetical protein